MDARVKHQNPDLSGSTQADSKLSSDVKEQSSRERKSTFFTILRKLQVTRKNDASTILSEDNLDSGLCGQVGYSTEPNKDLTQDSNRDAPSTDTFGKIREGSYKGANASVEISLSPRKDDFKDDSFYESNLHSEIASLQKSEGEAVTKPSAPSETGSVKTIKAEVPAIRVRSERSNWTLLPVKSTEKSKLEKSKFEKFFDRRKQSEKLDRNDSADGKEKKGEKQEEQEAKETKISRESLTRRFLRRFRKKPAQSDTT